MSGSAVARMLHEHAETSPAAPAYPSRWPGYSSATPLRPRRPVPADRFGIDGHALIADPSVEAVVEVMGGIEPARR